MSKHITLVADIGGTNARFASLYADQPGLHNLRIFQCVDFPHISDVIRAYLDTCTLSTIDIVCLAVPGVVEADFIDLPNNHWAFSQRELQNSFNVKLILINDFTAQLYSTFDLTPEELGWLGSARPSGKQIFAAVGPGTGLGAAGLTVKGDLIPSEGGHFAFAPLDEHERELLKLLWRRFPRVSVERILSGPGLECLYWANSILHGQEAELPAHLITSTAMSGDPVSLHAVSDFINIMGSTAGDIAIILGALDGIYLMGDMLTKLAPLYDPLTLRERFNDKGRYSHYCSGIPLAIVRAENTGLRGCAEYLRRLPSV